MTAHSSDPPPAAPLIDGANQSESANRVQHGGSTGLKDYLPIIWVAAIIVAIDQAAKVTVVNTMTRGSSIPVLGDWLRLTYTENPGMAFGIQFGPPALITLFAIAATVMIIVYLSRVGMHYAPYRFSLALVLGGAFGNIIDRVFYGKIFYDEPLFIGRVVDFIHVNVWRGHVPETIPIIGGSYFALFPIWNVADMAIVLGVVGILVFQNAFHRKLTELEVDGKALQSDSQSPPDADAQPQPETPTS